MELEPDFAFLRFSYSTVHENARCMENARSTNTLNGDLIHAPLHSYGDFRSSIVVLKARFTSLLFSYSTVHANARCMEIARSLITWTGDLIHAALDSYGDLLSSIVALEPNLTSLRSSYSTVHGICTVQRICSFLTLLFYFHQ
jgi:hypothetical protein